MCANYKLFSWLTIRFFLWVFLKISCFIINLFRISDYEGEKLRIFLYIERWFKFSNVQHFSQFKFFAIASKVQYFHIFKRKNQIVIQENNLYFAHSRIILVCWCWFPMLSLRCIFHKSKPSFYDTIKFEHLKLRLDNISLTDYSRWIFTTYSQ